MGGQGSNNRMMAGKAGMPAGGSFMVSEDSAADSNSSSM